MDTIVLWAPLGVPANPAWSKPAKSSKTAAKGMFPKGPIYQSQVLKTRIDPAFCRCSSPAACFTFFLTCFFMGTVNSTSGLGGTVSKQFASWLELSYCCVGSTCTSIFVASITPWVPSALAVRCRFAGSSGWSSNLLEPFSTPCVGCVLNPLLSGGNLWGKFSCRKAGHDQMLQ